MGRRRVPGHQPVPRPRTWACGSARSCCSTTPRPSTSSRPSTPAAWACTRTGGSRRSPLALEGSVAHHDSTGAGGVIHPGDVQWMTAAPGVLHKEYHEVEWARRGGRFHMVQLWVNLPAAHKMGPPRYQGLTAEQIGRSDLPDGAGIVRVVAGRYGDHVGPAETVTPINLWDLQLTGAAPVQLSFPRDETVALLVLDGSITVNGTAANHRDLVVLDDDGTDLTVDAAEPARVLLLNGTRIDEPVVAYGPFVMNTRTQIMEAIQDFESGAFGHLDD
ncbi:MAG: pirin-like C-terminal cupin domain-containing protein [Acidimicrobiales bacterium]